jgi:hypothetical protein
MRKLLNHQVRTQPLEVYALSHIASCSQESGCPRVLGVDTTRPVLIGIFCGLSQFLYYFKLVFNDLPQKQLERDFLVRYVSKEDKRESIVSESNFSTRSVINLEDLKPSRMVNWRQDPFDRTNKNI